MAIILLILFSVHLNGNFLLEIRNNTWLVAMEHDPLSIIKMGQEKIPDNRS
jgi:hypothetical protein